MIQNITFKGREGMITPVKQVSKEVSAEAARKAKAAFVSASSNLENTQNKVVAEIRQFRAKKYANEAQANIITNPADRYTSPFAPTGLKNDENANGTLSHIDFFG